MKTKNASGLVVGIVITLFVIILSGTIIVWGSGYFNQNKKTMDKSTSKIDKTIGSMTDFDLTVYDGKSIRGDALVELITELEINEVQISIGVKTIAGVFAYYVNNFTPTSKDLSEEGAATITTDKTHEAYINPNGTFIGDVIKNDNKEIVCIQFTQQP